MSARLRSRREVESLLCNDESDSFSLSICTECSSRCLFITSVFNNAEPAKLPGYHVLRAPFRKSNEASSDVTRAKISTSHIDHAAQSLIDVDADTELLNGIVCPRHTN
jgi:hypothetical protein